MHFLRMFEVFQALEFPWREFFAVLSFWLGACVGSFLNVCIYRIPRELSIVAPRSFCPHCRSRIAWYDNIPLISYSLLMARCRRCKGPISVRYPVVELLTALVFLLVWLKFDIVAGSRVLGLVPVAELKVVLAYWLVVYGLVLGTFVDFEHLIIPDRVTLGGIAAGLILSGLIPSLHGELSWAWSLIWAFSGAAFGWGLLWCVSVLGKIIFKKDAMGFGDVKLMGAIGAFFGARAVLFTLFVSSLAGSIVGIALVASGRKQMQSKIPYGPYIALAALIWMLWGETIWGRYFSMLTGGTG